MNREDFKWSRQQEEKVKEKISDNNSNLEDNLQSNQNIIRGSQRSDGTYRKDIKIRDGFKNLFDAERYKIPQRRGEGTENFKETNGQHKWRNDAQESQNYKHTGKQGFQNWRTTTESKKDISGENMNQAKTQKKINSVGEEEDFPNLNMNQATQNKSILEKNQKGNNPFGLKQFDCDSNNSSNSFKIGNNNDNINNLHFSTTNKDKELKKLHKKLREIENLEERQKNGLELQPEAVEKINKKDDIVKMLDKLSLQDTSDF